MLYSALLIGLTTTGLMLVSSLGAEDWDKKACKKAERWPNRRAYTAFYMEKASLIGPPNPSKPVEQGGALTTMAGATTSRITFHLGSPQVIKSFVCDLKDVEGLTAEEAAALYQRNLAPHRAGYIPVIIHIETQAKTTYALPEYGNDESADHGVYLQDKKNPDHFLSEVGKHHLVESLSFLRRWSRTRQGSSLMLLFPYDVAFFSSTKRIEIEIRDSGLKGKKRKRGTFPKKMGKLLVEQMGTIADFNRR